MGTQRDPPPDPSLHAPLPKYIARYLNYGFDSDDISALIDSIDEEHHGSARPHLPAEILFYILDFVRVDYILDFRFVCRGFRHYIDTHVLYSYLLRTKIVGYIGPKSLYHSSNNRLSKDSYEKLSLFYAEFSHIEKAENEEFRTKWGGTKAVFKISETFMDQLEAKWGKASDHFNGQAFPSIVWQELYKQFNPALGSEYHGMRWFIQLDQASLNVPSSFVVAVDFTTRSIILRWKDILKDFLVSESKLREIIKKNEDSMFTFGHHEDCLRAVLRERQRFSLDLNVAEDRRLSWSMNSLLRPLYKLPGYNREGNEFSKIEDDGIKALNYLRKEAAMTKTELEYRKQILVDRKTMFKEIQNLDAAFAVFKSYLYEPTQSGPTKMVHPGTRSLERLPRNPIAWSEKTLRREEERIRTWKSQRMTMTKIEDLLRGANDVLQLPDGAFDDSDV